MNSLDNNLTGHSQNNILLSSLIDLNDFEGKPSEFFQKLIQVKRVAVEAAGAALLKKTSDTYGLVAASPEITSKPPEWIPKALEKLKAQPDLEGLYCNKISDDERDDWEGRFSGSRT